jgi:hypothetical protein
MDTTFEELTEVLKNRQVRGSRYIATNLEVTFARAEKNSKAAHRMIPMQ